jgi:hypothetical protein
MKYFTSPMFSEAYQKALLQHSIFGITAYFTRPKYTDFGQKLLPESQSEWGKSGKNAQIE